MRTKNISLMIGIAACLTVSCGLPMFSNKHSDGSNAQSGDGKQDGDLGQRPRMTLAINRSASVPSNLALIEDSASGDQTAGSTGVKVDDRITITSAVFSISAVKVKQNADKTPDEKDAEASQDKEESSILAQIFAIITAAKDGSRDNLLETIKKLDQELLAKIADKDGSTKYKGPFVYDAIKNTMTPSMPEVTLEEGSYRRIDFRFSRYFSNDSPSNLERKVYRIEGTFRDASDQIRPFVIEDHHSMKLSLSSKDAFVAEPLKLNNVVIEFDVAQWFRGVDLNAAKSKDDGLVEITSRRNKRLLKIFNANLKSSAKFSVNGSVTGTSTATDTSTGTSTATGTSTGTDTETGTSPDDAVQDDDTADDPGTG